MSLGRFFAIARKRFTSLVYLFMRITSIRLQHFRNLVDISLEVGYGRVGFLGENAQGKTNILEGLYILSRGESWRAVLDSDLIAYKSAFARVDGTIVANQEKNDLALVIERNIDRAGVKKSYLVNDIKRKKRDIYPLFSCRFVFAGGYLAGCRFSIRTP